MKHSGAGRHFDRLKISDQLGIAVAYAIAKPAILEDTCELIALFLEGANIAAALVLRIRARLTTLIGL